MSKARSRMVRWLLFATLAVVALAGCSQDSLVEPQQNAANVVEAGGAADQVVLADQLQIEGRVATVEEATLTLTLVDVAESIVADDDCVIFEMVAGVESVLEFGDLAVGDSVRVCGALQEDGTILAQRIRIFCEGDCADSYLVFRDTIASIDYAAGTFTVVNRAETITVDAATVIWSNLGQHGQALGFGDDPPNGRGKTDIERDTILAFTDLFVGAVVEVRANVIDPTTLYAVSIKLANCSLRQCELFEAILASVDVENRVVTFAGLSWIGSVCPGAELLGLNGEPLTLTDFLAGDLVSVKGIALTENTLQVSLLQKL